MHAQRAKALDERHGLQLHPTWYEFEPREAGAEALKGDTEFDPGQ